MLPHTGVLRRFILLSVLAHSSTCPENHSSLRHERSVHESVRGRLYANHNSDTILLGSRWAARTTCPTARAPALPCPCLSLLAKATVTPNGCWRNHSLGKKVGKVVLSSLPELLVSGHQRLQGRRDSTHKPSI